MEESLLFHEVDSKKVPNIYGSYPSIGYKFMNTKPPPGKNPSTLNLPGQQLVRLLNYKNEWARDPITGFMGYYG